jgi:fatty acid desaturase
MMQNRGIPAVINLSLAAFYGAVNLYQFFILPLWLLPAHRAWALTLLPLALLTNPFWSLIHEAIHDLFHSNRAVNGCAGRVFGIMFGAPFRILRLSHLLHHKLNRLPVEGTEYFDKCTSSKSATAPGYYLRILIGLYLFEVISSLWSFLPRAWLQTVKDRYMTRDGVSGMLMQNCLTGQALREIRVDGLLALAWLGLSFYAYGEQWRILLALVAARGFLISFFDNVYHYETPVADSFYAKNLRLAAPLSKLLLNFNLHGIHHVNPAISWINLAEGFRVQKAQYQGGYFAAAWRQMRGPVALQELPGGADQRSL